MSYIKGEVSHQVYLNVKNNYGVYKVSIEETDEPLLDFKKTATIAGTFFNIDVGSIYKFTGKMSFKERYGYSFIADTAERVLPTSKEGIIEYLSGDQFIGIGKKTATLIVDELGEDAIAKISSSIHALDNIKSLSEKKKELIYNVIISSAKVENILITLYSYDITPKMAMRIYDRFQDETLNIIKDNPYRLINEVEGIAFLKADKIALKTGISPYNENRIDSCISYSILLNAEETGDTYISYDDLTDKVRTLLSFTSDDDTLILKEINKLKSRSELVDYGENNITDVRLYMSEKYIADKLYLMSQAKVETFRKSEIDNIIKEFEKANNIIYEDEQKEAIYNALNNNVSIITGGPGVGKTTIERGILYAYQELVTSEASYIKLCAPTGKAAKRIEESTNFTAKTIHKLLGYDTMGNFAYNKFNPLDVKLLILDEASMVDIFLFKRLLEAIPLDTKVVIVGDSDQLPSIGPGEVLKNLIDSDKFIVSRLTKIHRQKETSQIVSLAYDCLKGTVDTIIDDDRDDLIFIPAYQEDLNSILLNVINHFSGLGYSLEQDIQILIPMYKSMVGIEAVNKFIQMSINSKVSNDSPFEYFIEDKVIQLVNQYEDGVMNGDIGIVTDVTLDTIKVMFQENEVTYKGSDIYNIQLAYAISVHKSQGSEFPVVIIPFFNNYRVLLNKKLVYTAITRAKEYLVIIGDARCFRETIKVMTKARKTILEWFLKNKK